MRDRLRQDDPSARLSTIGIALVFLVGVCLRAHGIGAQLVFADEIHALTVLPGHGYGYLFSHFSLTDTCIPLTLYYRALMDTVGLNELLMRLPSLISGCATILLVAVFAWRRCGPLGSWLASGMLAFSPYHVYLSREARPYPIVIFLMMVAVMAVFEWDETSSTRALLLAGAAAFLALYFHLLAFPMVSALGAFVLWKGLRGSRQARIAVLRAGALFASLCALFFLPAAPSLLETMAARASRGSQGLPTFQNGIYLFLTVHHSDWAWETALAGAGLYWLRAKRSEVSLLVFLIAFQVVLVLILNPQSSEIPWVWARYVAFALPLWIVLIAAGLAGILNRIRFPHIPELIALTMLAGLFFYDAGLYGFDRNRNYLVHPMVMAHELDDPGILSTLPIPAFYRQLAREPGAGGILEMPLNMGFPLYDLEQRVHKRPLYSAGVGTGMWQRSFDHVDGFRFARMLSISDLTESDLPIEYIVVHKAVGNENSRIYRRLAQIPTTARLLAGFGRTLTPETSDQLFGDGAELRQWAARTWGRPVYEDADIVVYRFHRIG
jgi:hypothetical protein